MINLQTLHMLATRCLEDALEVSEDLHNGSVGDVNECQTKAGHLAFTFDQVGEAYLALDFRALAERLGQFANDLRAYRKATAEPLPPGGCQVSVYPAAQTALLQVECNLIQKRLLRWVARTPELKGNLAMHKADLYSRALDCLAASDTAVYNLESEHPAVDCQMTTEHVAEEFAAIGESCLSRRFNELSRKLGFFVTDLLVWKGRNEKTLGTGSLDPKAKGNDVTALQMSRLVKDDNRTTRHKLQQWFGGG